MLESASTSASYQDVLVCFGLRVGFGNESLSLPFSLSLKNLQLFQQHSLLFSLTAAQSSELEVQTGLGCCVCSVNAVIWTPE